MLPKIKAISEFNQICQVHLNLYENPRKEQAISKSCTANRTMELTLGMNLRATSFAFTSFVNPLLSEHDMSKCKPNQEIKNYK